jgi:hypothetical protein
MNKITAIFNFKQRKTVGEAIILYCVSAGGLLGIVLLIGSILEIIFGVGYVFGFWFGVITSISASIFLSLRILSQRKLGFINKVLLLVGVVLAGAYGFYIGMIPLAIVALSYDNNDIDSNTKVEPTTKEKSVEEKPVVKEKPVEEKPPVVKEKPVEEKPVVKEKPVEEKPPVVKEKPVEEKPPVVKEKPVEVDAISSMKDNNISELATNLTQLNELKEKGILTEEEFTEQKKKLLK